jgi:hypothetical protein
MTMSVVERIAAEHGLTVSFDEGLGVRGAYLFHWPDNRPPIRLDAYVAEPAVRLRERLAPKIAECLRRRDRNRRKRIRQNRQHQEVKP